MSDQEKMMAIAAITGETDDDTLSLYLQTAGEAILERAYPFRPDITEVPARYAKLQIEIAVYLINKRGAEGETTHNENGINRAYESASIPESLLGRVTPFAGVIGA
ncbi:MAG: phage head-tail connector protein [Clostridia bacterium]|nr:phage head-tail connector protein [Clostridia bacterium]